MRLTVLLGAALMVMPLTQPFPLPFNTKPPNKRSKMLNELPEEYTLQSGTPSNFVKDFANLAVHFDQWVWDTQAVTWIKDAGNTLQEKSMYDVLVGVKDHAVILDHNIGVWLSERFGE